MIHNAKHLKLGQNILKCPKQISLGGQNLRKGGGGGGFKVNQRQFLGKNNLLTIPSGTYQITLLVKASHILGLCLIAQLKIG